METIIRNIFFVLNMTANVLLLSFVWFGTVQIVKGRKLVRESPNIKLTNKDKIIDFRKRIEYHFQTADTFQKYLYLFITLPPLTLVIRDVLLRDIGLATVFHAMLAGCWLGHYIQERRDLSTLKRKTDRIDEQDKMLLESAATNATIYQEYEKLKRIHGV